MLCRPELDLAHPGNVRVKASMTAGVLRSDDPRFLSAQSFSRKFYVPSTGALYGLGKDCGRSFAYISHQWTRDRPKYLDQCRALAAKLKENGIPMTLYSRIAAPGR